MNQDTSQQPFDRATLRGAPLRLLNKGRWGNADLWLYDREGCTWVVKDFSRWPFLIRRTWGAYSIWRECRMLRKLQGISGVPQEVFRVDALAFGYRYVPGRTLKQAPPELTPPRYFEELEELARRIHERGVVHLDIRYKRNVLITEEGHPILIDFLTAQDLNRVPRWLRRHLINVDLSGVYKHWYKQHPDSLGPERRALLSRLNRLRRFWVLKGYGGLKTSSRIRKKRAL